MKILEIIFLLVIVLLGVVFDEDVGGLVRGHNELAGYSSISEAEKYWLLHGEKTQIKGGNVKACCQFISDKTLESYQ
jgi:hypothetical protein